MLISIIHAFLLTLYWIGVVVGVALLLVVVLAVLVKAIQFIAAIEEGPHK